MYIGSQKLMMDYDQCLINNGYSIIELVDKASDCLLKHMNYSSYSLLCGPGNNGADGLSLALKLMKQGKKVNVYIFEDQNHLSKANRYYLDCCYEEGMHIVLLHADVIDVVMAEIEKSDVVIDAMFGNGLNSSPRGIYQIVIEELNHLYDKEIIAIDIPTGLDCDSGNPYQSVICATQTITLTALKNGFLNPDSLFFTGKVIVEQLDVDDVYDEVGLYQLVDEEFILPILKDRQFYGHKGTYGRVGLITGCQDYKGAALLSGKSAVYSGSGIVSVITEQQVIDSLTVFCPEATTQLRPPIFQKEDFIKYQALLIGCGLGQSLDSYRYVMDVFTLSTQPLVIDADALTILATRLDLLKNQERDIILTPHMGEFKRLCDFCEEDDILLVAKDFARQHNVILVLKGPYTMITDGQEAYRIATGNKAMASGGMGDVLAGMIVSFLGQGYSGIQAAMLGVYIHGYAGDQIARDAYTVIPSQLIQYIPRAMKELIQKREL